jgi:hypothetical protein
LYRYETNDPWIGGDNGNANINFRKLGNRTQYLKQRADEVDDAKEGAASLKERIRAAGSAPRPLYMRQFIPDAPVATSTENVDITAGGLLEIDGIQTQAGDLVFLKDQIDPIENGYWEAQTGAWNRYAGYESGNTDCFTNVMIDVNSGDTNSGSIFAVDADAYTVGTDALIFRECFYSSFKRPGTALLRNRRGEVVDLLELTANGYGQYREGRNLLDVLNVTSIADLMTELRRRCNGTGKPDFSGLMIGDYFDLPSIAIAGTAYQWNESYKNLRILLSGFNQFKNVGDTENVKNHVLFTFRNCVLTRRMNSSDTNAGGYASSEMADFLGGDFKNGLQAAIGDYIYPFKHLHSTKGSWAWKTDTVFLPTEYEVFGAPVWSEVGYGGGFQCQFPIFQQSSEYLVKRYNGSRQSYWLASPYAGGGTSFVSVDYGGYAYSITAGSVYGCAPAFCVA